MKCTTPEISWHNRDPVLSVDIQSGLHENSKGGAFWRVATGGADCHVLIWHLTTTECGGATVNCVADLVRHQKAVNVVRFSPSKEILASGDDESVIILWKLREGPNCSPSLGDTENKEQWTSWKVLKGHIEDIYDISWSPDSNSLVSGSVDNTAILWDVRKGRHTAILSDHKGFVQGVSWDPCNQYVCTISTDRQCRLIDIATKKVVQRVHKSKIPTPPGHPLEEKVVRLFHDDTFKSFFRRLTFSIDGSLILVPSGIIEPTAETTENVSNATIVFSRENIKEPIMILPTLSEYTIAVRCCPVYFELQQNGPISMITLPYRMIFAVATQHSVSIYDTQQTFPIAIISNIHYGRLNDVSWSSDGRILIVSSSDGYCSIIHFQEGELGKPYKMKDPINQSKKVPNSSNKKSLSNAIKNNAGKSNVSTFDVDDSAMDINLAECDTAKTVHNVSEKLDNQKPDEVVCEQGNTRVIRDIQAANKSSENVNEEETEDIKLVYNEESNSDVSKSKAKSTPPKTNVIPIITHKTPRRVQLITLSSPKGFKRQ